MPVVSTLSAAMALNDRHAVHWLSRTSQLDLQSLFVGEAIQQRKAQRASPAEIRTGTRERKKGPGGRFSDGKLANLGELGSSRNQDRNAAEEQGSPRR